MKSEAQTALQQLRIEYIADIITLILKRAGMQRDDIEEANAEAKRLVSGALDVFYGHTDEILGALRETLEMVIEEQRDSELALKTNSNSRYALSLSST